jgi:hypothetical protein
LIRGAAAVPEKEPLQQLAVLKCVVEAKMVILVEFIQQIEEFCRRLMDRKWRRLGVVDDDWDST